MATDPPHHECDLLLLSVIGSQNYKTNPIQGTRSNKTQKAQVCSRTLLATTNAERLQERRDHIGEEAWQRQQWPCAAKDVAIGSSASYDRMADPPIGKGMDPRRTRIFPASIPELPLTRDRRRSPRRPFPRQAARALGAISSALTMLRAASTRLRPALHSVVTFIGRSFTQSHRQAGSQRLGR